MLRNGWFKRLAEKLRSATSDRSQRPQRRVYVESLERREMLAGNLVQNGSFEFDSVNDHDGMRLVISSICLSLRMQIYTPIQSTVMTRISCRALRCLSQMTTTISWPKTSMQCADDEQVPVLFPPNMLPLQCG